MIMGGVKPWVAALCVALALLTAACGSADSAEPVAVSSCSAVHHEGDGEPNVIIVSDLPLRGIAAATTKRMVAAIEHVLGEREFRAGKYRVGYQSCNDTVGDEPYDPLVCKKNAQAYVAARDVVGIIGPWNSGCAVLQIPLVSRRAAGPLAMISPSNTFAALTREVSAGSPATVSLYPDGVRSYVRVVTHDFAQGAAAARLASRLGAQRVAVIHQNLGDEYVQGLTTSFLAAARSLQLDVEEFDWEERETYAVLASSVAAARPGAVYLSGLTQVNAKRLVEDLRASLPRNVELIGPDSFAAEDVARELGAAGEGMYVTVPGIPVGALPAAGERLVLALGLAAGEPDATYVAGAAQAAVVLLDAIARSDGTRSSIVDEMFAARVVDGILGSFSFDRFGDIVPAPVGVYRFGDGKLVLERVIQTASSG